MVRAKANKISGSDDALVKRLQQEIQHLRDILNIRRKGGQGELAEQLLMLKSENNKLKEKNMGMKDVEKLMHENKQIKLELQRLMQNNTHQNFHNPNQQIEMGEDGEIFNMTNYNNWEQEDAKPLNESNLNDQPMFK
jgi:anaerobic ribonucleoside-triphosphate reductase